MGLLCCFPDRAKDEVDASYKVLADGPDDNSNLKDETISMQNTEHKSAPKEVESKEASLNEAQKPEGAKASELQKSSQPVENVPEPVIMEKKAEPIIDKVGSVGVEETKLNDQSNNNGAVKEPKTVTKAEDCSPNRSAEAEKNKVMEKEDDVQDILDEAISINVDKNKPQGTDKPKSVEEQKAVTHKPETVTNEKDNVRPVEQSIKLCNVSRDVIKELKKEEDNVRPVEQSVKLSNVSRDVPEELKKEEDDVRPVEQSIKLCNVSRDVQKELNKEEVTNGTKKSEEKREEK